MPVEYRASCKDCGKEFGYSETSLQGGSVRGLSRPERCPGCRKLHSREGRSVGIPQIPVRARMLRKPTEALKPGRLGKLFHPERVHTKVRVEGTFGRPDSGIELGITDDDIRQLVETTGKYQVTVVVGPTGSGKSTFLPYRLMVPPEGVPRDVFTRYGQIVVTQPRIQATRSVSKFVAETLHGSSLGAGFDVGFRHSNAPASDWRNKLVYLTDGTLINWIINGQIANLSVIMIDEAHERSITIDLILGLLRQQLPRYPHLKLIIASATINADLFRNYFGGPEKVGLLKFRGLRQHTVHAYFPDYDSKLENDRTYFTKKVPEKMADKVVDILLAIARGDKGEGDILGFLTGKGPIDSCVKRIRQEIHETPELRNRGIQVYPLYTNLPQETQDCVLAEKTAIICDKILAIFRNHDMSKGLRILALFLDFKTANKAQEKLREIFDCERTNIGGISQWIITVLPPGKQGYDCFPRQIVLTTHDDAKNMHLEDFDYMVYDRRVIISTNVAETSLTIDGIVYVVDSGLINQSRWDSEHTAQDLSPLFHSRAGCRQRWGRAGRVRDGEAHALYTDAQFENEFSAHGEPEIRRTSLENIVLSARSAGIDNLDNFTWIEPPPVSELKRATSVLKKMGALDEENDITNYGMELKSYTTTVPVADQLILADQFACGIEMATFAAIPAMGVAGGLLKDTRNWDFSSQYEFDNKVKMLARVCKDDLELKLKIYSIWSEAKTREDRERLGKLFFIDAEQIKRDVVPARNEFLQMLSLGKKSEEDRPINFEMLDRLRIILAVSLPDEFLFKAKDGTISSLTGVSVPVDIDMNSLFSQAPPGCFLALERKMHIAKGGEKRIKISSLVALEPSWLELRKRSLLNLASSITKILESRERAPGKYRSCLFLDVNFPIGTYYEKQKDGEGNTTVGLKIADPLPRKPVLDDGIIDWHEKPFEKESHDISSSTAGWEDKGTTAYDSGEEPLLPPPDEIVDGPDSEEPEAIRINCPVDKRKETMDTGAAGEFHYSLIQTEETKAAGAMKPVFRFQESDTVSPLCVVAGYDYSNPENPIVILDDYQPEKDHAMPSCRIKYGDRITVEVIGILSRDNGREKALHVRERQTNREHIIEPEQLTFWGRWDMVEKFTVGNVFDVILECDPGGIDVLTTLPVEEDKIHNTLSKFRKDTVIEAEALLKDGKNVYFSIFPDLEFPLGIVHTARLNVFKDNAVQYEAGKKYPVVPKPEKLGSAGVSIHPVPSGMLDFVEKEKFRHGIFWDSKNEKLCTTKPMETKLRDTLLGFSSDPCYRKSIKDLYRHSNQISVFPGTSSKKRNPPKNTAIPVYNPGEILDGAIIKIYKWGVLVRLKRGGVGSVPLRQICWRQIFHPGEEVHERQDVIVRFQDVGEKGINLTMLNPEENPAKKYHKGNICEATIVKVSPQYALAELEPGVSGLIPVKEITYKYVNDIHEYLNEGQRVVVIITQIEARDDIANIKHSIRIVLSIKRVLDSVREVTIGEILDAFAIAEMEEGIRGIIHIKEISYTPVKDIKQHLSLGQKVRARVVPPREDRLCTERPYQLCLSIRRAFPMERVGIPVSKIPLLIGKQGSHIKALMNKSNTVIMVHDDGIVTVVNERGGKDAIGQAIQGIRSRIPEAKIID